MSPRVGIVALQGGYSLHATALQRVGARTVAVREPEDLAQLDALVIPGGESTTIGMLMERFGLLAGLREYGDRIAILGTCAGAILLADEIRHSTQPRIGTLDATVERNAYGRQVESFEADLQLSILERPFRAVFVRAPRFLRVGAGVRTLARFEGLPVAVQQRRMLALSFHPELTDDVRLHEYFLQSVVG